MYVYIHTYVYIYIHGRERCAYACMSVSRGGGSAECPKQDKMVESNQLVGTNSNMLLMQHTCGQRSIMAA